MADRSFSHAIAEGDGISVIAAVEDADAARSAESQRAKPSSCAAIRRQCARRPRCRSSGGPTCRSTGERCRRRGDALFDSLDDDDGRLEELHQRALQLGLDCAVEVRDEEEVELVLSGVDPEIFLLRRSRRTTTIAAEGVLDLLAAVPAGKLAIADLRVTTPSDVAELEYAGGRGDRRAATSRRSSAVRPARGLTAA